jgi:hypothetical protein
VLACQASKLAKAMMSCGSPELRALQTVVYSPERLVDTFGARLSMPVVWREVALALAKQARLLNLLGVGPSVADLQSAPEPALCAAALLLLGSTQHAHALQQQARERAEARATGGVAWADDDFDDDDDDDDRKDKEQEQAEGMVVKPLAVALPQLSVEAVSAATTVPAADLTRLAAALNHHRTRLLPATVLQQLHDAGLVLPEITK